MAQGRKAERSQNRQNNLDTKDGCAEYRSSTWYHAAIEGNRQKWLSTVQESMWEAMLVEVLEEMKNSRDARREAKAHNKLADGYHRKGQFDKAIAEYREALRIDPSNNWGHYNLALLYHDKGQLDEAIAEYYELLKIDPNLVPAHHDLGMIYKAKGQHDAATREFEEAIRIQELLELEQGKRRWWQFWKR